MKGVGLKYGQYAGLGLIILTLVLYLVSPKTMLTHGSWLSFIVLLVFMVIASRELRTEQGDVLSLGDGFKVSWITWAIAAILSGIFSIILIYLIDPSLLQITEEMSIEATEKIMRRFGASEDSIVEAIDKMEDSFTEKSLGQIIGQFFMQTAFSLIIGAIISIIVAAFMKRKPRNEDFA